MDQKIVFLSERVVKTCAERFGCFSSCLVRKLIWASFSICLWIYCHELLIRISTRFCDSVHLLPAAANRETIPNSFRSYSLPDLTKKTNPRIQEVLIYLQSEHTQSMCWGQHSATHQIYRRSICKLAEISTVAMKLRLNNDVYSGAV